MDIEFHEYLTTTNSSIFFGILSFNWFQVFQWIEFPAESDRLATFQVRRTYLKPEAQLGCIGNNQQSIQSYLT